MGLTRWVSAVAAVVAVAGCSAESISGTSVSVNGAGSPTSLPAPMVLIVDASGSMTEDDAPGLRIDAAKAAANGLIAELPAGMQFGLLTYGTGTGSSDAEQSAGCQDVTTLVPIGPLSASGATAKVNSLVPRGYTPISRALRKAADALPTDGSAQSIVLVSDGEDTCGEPPCETAKALTSTHSGLSISTVGFKTGSAASDALACVANATGGLAVTADNAKQLAARLLATTNVEAAHKTLTSTGISGVNLGDTYAELRSRYSDFPSVTGSGEVVVVWKDCDLTFEDGVLTSIAPHDGGRTIDGIGPGTSVEDATGMYGAPVTEEDSTLVYTADADREYAYRMKIKDLSGSGTSYRGTVQTIVLCKCLPKKVDWEHATKDGYGPVRIGMTAGEVAAATGIAGRTLGHCTIFSFTSPSGGQVTVTIHDSEGTVITIQTPPGTKTDRGVGDGSTLAQITAAYPELTVTSTNTQAGPAIYATSEASNRIGLPEFGFEDHSGVAGPPLIHGIPGFEYCSG